MHAKDSPERPLAHPNRGYQGAVRVGCALGRKGACSAAMSRSMHHSGRIGSRATTRPGLLRSTPQYLKNERRGIVKLSGFELGAAPHVQIRGLLRCPSSSSRDIEV